MPLRHLLYRCPYCGHDPVVGDGAAAACPGCLREFVPGSGRIRLEVVDGAGVHREVLVNELTDRLARQEMPRDRGMGVDGSGLEAAARMRIAAREKPVRMRGVLLGYREHFGSRRPGTLRLAEDRLTFVERSGRVHEWRLADVRALQGSSSSIQISPHDGVVVTFRLKRDSPRRWEELLRDRLRAVWREEGRGEIAEFQPRIRGR